MAVKVLWMLVLFIAGGFACCRGDGGRTPAKPRGSGLSAASAAPKSYDDAVKAIDAAVDSDSATALPRLGAQLDRVWFGPNPGAYYDLLQVLCRDVHQKRNASSAAYSFLETYLVTALNRRPWPTPDQLDLPIRSLMCDQAYLDGRAVDFVRLRDLKAQILLGALDRTAAQFDKTVDLSRRLPGTVIPPVGPDGRGMPAGVDPTAIKDPNTRSAYVTELRQLDVEKAKQEAQTELHIQYDRLAFFVEWYLTTSYARMPYDNVGLTRNLRTYSAPPAFADRILRRVLGKTDPHE